MPQLTPDYLKTIMPPNGLERIEERDEGPGAEPGLILRVTDKGIKSWSVRYRNAAGEQRRKMLGNYPIVGLARARIEARKAKGEIASKVDLVGVDKETKAAARKKKLSTLDGLTEAYWTAAALGTHVSGNARPKREATITEEKRVYEKHVKPAFGQTAVTDMKRGDIQTFVDKISKKFARGTGRQCRDIIRQLLSYAVRQGLVEYNVAIGVGAVSAQPRNRVLNDDEVKALWAAFERPDDIEGLDLSPLMGIALRLALVTMQRGGQIVGLRWDEIDRARKLWSLPPERMKAKKPHIVPLSDLALGLLDEAAALKKGNGDGFVFASPRDAESGVERRAFSRAMKRVTKKLNIARATPHDFRRTGASNITGERIGMSRFIAGQILAHNESGVTAKHYDMSDYLGEKRKGLDAWALLLQEIVTGNVRPDNVASLAEKRAEATA